MPIVQPLLRLPGNSLRMRLSILFMTAVFLNVSASGISQPVTLHVRNAPLAQVFREIHKQTGFVFIYGSALLETTKKMDIQVEKASLKEVLDQCFKDQSITYTIDDNKYIVIKPRPAVTPPVVRPSGRQAGTPVTGRITDDAGQPLAGATITVEDRKSPARDGLTGPARAAAGSSAQSAADGLFSVNVIEGDVLRVTFVGYEQREFKITPGMLSRATAARAGAADRQSDPLFSITLEKSVTSLNEVIVNKGYYTTTQQLNTGNVSIVKGDDISKQPVGDPIMALEGRVSGLYITQYSGIPGDNNKVQLRGQNFIPGQTPVSLNDPLYIVDGVPFGSSSMTNINIGGGSIGGGMSPFNALNPSDIDRIEVLKDADATAIYGSRGANGVILITTKKGKAGSTRLEVNLSSGVGKIADKMHLLNTPQYLAMRHRAFYNDSVAGILHSTVPSAINYDVNGTWDTTRNTDWQKELIGGRSAFTNAQLSLSGGNANTQFVLGGGYLRQTTVFPGDFSDKKASVHANINHSSTNQKLHVLFSAQYINDNSTMPDLDFTNSTLLAPDAPALYNPDGSINWAVNAAGVSTWNNPIAGMFNRDHSITNNLIGDLNVSYEIVPGLQVSGKMGYTHMEMNQSNQYPDAAIYGPPVADYRGNYFATTTAGTWIIEPQATYTRKIGQGRLNVLAGATFQQNDFNSLGQAAEGFSSDALIPNVAAASTVYIVGNTVSEYHYAAVFGRLSYDWQEKYLLNLTARRDGSSRFGPGKQFGNFGAVGAGWIFSKEDWVKEKLPFLSFGKLRGSYGTTGNDQIADYQYLSTYSSYIGSDYQGVSTLYPTLIANPYFAWEVVKKLEGGLELGFLKDRIRLMASYYRNRSGDQLIGQPLPTTTGFNFIQANLPAVVQNTGLELELNTVNIRNKGFSWTSSFNISIPRNKLISFPGLATNTTYKNNYAVGKSIFTRSAYHYTGVDPRTGLYTYQDVDHNGVIDLNTDVQLLKQVAQNYFGGFQNSFSYKGWQLDVFFQFVKQTGLNYQNSISRPGTLNVNEPTLVLNAWQTIGDEAGMQQYSTSTTSPAGKAWSKIRTSDAIITDAGFVRLKSVFLSYALPKSWQQRMHLQNLKVYVQGQNLLTFTKYRVLDPETQRLALPPLRMITGGIQVSL